MSLEPLPMEQIRVGDADRRAVDARLQQAVGDGVLSLYEYDERAALVWAARTRADLAPVTRDLPGADPLAAPVPPRAPTAVPAAASRPRPRWAVAVMSGHETRGPVLPGQATNAVAVMGGAVVDLRRPDLPPVTDVTALAVMGGIEVLVPVGARVECSGLSVMGGRDEKVQPGRPDAPLVRLRAYAVMGGVEVKHGPAAGRAEAVPAGTALEPAAARPPRGRRQRRPRTPARVAVRVALTAALVGGVAVGGAAVAVHSDASAVFGSARRQVDLAPGSVRDYDAGVLFGSVTVVVAPGVHVDAADGTVVFGSQECRACANGNPPPGPGVPVLRVHERGGFGSIQVVRSGQQPDGG